MDEAKQQEIFLAYMLKFKCLIATAEHFNMSVADVEGTIELERSRVKTAAYAACRLMYADYSSGIINAGNFCISYAMSDEEATNVLAIGEAVSKLTE